MSGTPAEVVLCDAGPSDSAVLAVLHAECFPTDAWPETALATLLAQPGCLALLALRAGEPLGFALWRRAADECEILSLGVRPAARRQGIGRRLIDELCRRAAAAGSAVLYLEVAADNAAARALYTRAAFRESGRRKAYYHHKEQQPIDALVLMRPL